MNYFNSPLSLQRAQYSNSQTAPIDPTKFQQGVQQLNKEALAQLVQQARARGISDSEIEAGLNYILKLK